MKNSRQSNKATSISETQNYRERIGSFTASHTRKKNISEPSWHLSSNNSHWLTLLACLLVVAHAREVQAQISCTRFSGDPANPKNYVNCTIPANKRTEYPKFKECTAQLLKYSDAHPPAQLIVCDEKLQHLGSYNNPLRDFACYVTRAGGPAGEEIVNNHLEDCIDQHQTPRNDL